MKDELEKRATSLSERILEDCVVPYSYGADTCGVERDYNEANLIILTALRVERALLLSEIQHLLDRQQTEAGASRVPIWVREIIEEALEREDEHR